MFGVSGSAVGPAAFPREKKFMAIIKNGAHNLIYSWKAAWRKNRGAIKTKGLAISGRPVALLNGILLNQINSVSGK